MKKILRWYINRIYKDQNLVNGYYQFIEVKIVPNSNNINTSLDHIKSVESDNLNWWTKDENLFLFGYIAEDILITVLEEKNFSSSNLKKDHIKKRRITEGMVLLQFFNKDVSVSKYLYDLRKRKKIPNLKKLATMEGSKWLDFTQQTRKMSKDLYKEILGLSGDDNA